MKGQPGLSMTVKNYCHLKRRYLTILVDIAEYMPTYRQKSIIYRDLFITTQKIRGKTQTRVSIPWSDHKT